MHKNNKKLSIAEITELMSGLLEGLSKLSEQGIVHRDLKFENIMLRDLNTF
jgi:serine/threonine protein kinase